MPFEEFQFKKRPNPNEAMISVLKQGTMNINQTCYNKYFRRYKFILFLFDKDKKKIGMRPTNSATSNSYPIRSSRKGNLNSVSAMSFLKHYDIVHLTTKAYLAHWNERENLVEIDLNS